MCKKNDDKVIIMHQIGLAIYKNFSRMRMMKLRV